MHANAIGDDVAMSPGFGCGCHRETLFSSGIVIDDRSFYLLDQVGYGDTTGAGIGAVEDRAATPDALALSQDGRRSSAPWSRLSKMKPCAFTIAAGPTPS